MALRLKLLQSLVPFLNKLRSKVHAIICLLMLLTLKLFDPRLNLPVRVLQPVVLALELLDLALVFTLKELDLGYSVFEAPFIRLHVESLLLDGDRV